MLSAQTLLGLIYELLLKDGVELNDRRYGRFYAAGNDDQLLFNVDSIYPKSATDFTVNKGACILSGPIGGSVDDLGQLAVWPLTATCFALGSPDCGYLAEHVLRTIKHWNREDFPVINQQCLQNFHGFRLSGPQYIAENDLFFSVVQFTATVSSQAQKQAAS